jgi:hypothetical protein
MMSIPLDLEPSLCVGLTSDQIDRLTRLDRFDLDFLAPHLIEKAGYVIPPGKTDLAIRELKRFLALPALWSDEIIVPSAQIDAAWHHLLLHTHVYTRLCDEVHGQYIHHIPRAPTEPTHDAGFAWTLKRYEQAWGQPHAIMWAPVRLRRHIPVAPLTGLTISLGILVYLAGRRQ